MRVFGFVDGVFSLSRSTGIILIEETLLKYSNESKIFLLSPGVGSSSSSTILFPLASVFLYSPIWGAILPRVPILNGRGLNSAEKPGFTALFSRLGDLKLRCTPVFTLNIGIVGSESRVARISLLPFFFRLSRQDWMFESETFPAYRNQILEGNNT